MTAPRSTAARALVALVLAALGAAPSAAAFEPIQLVSASAREQADLATLPAISEDGRYIAFQGSLDGTAGIFRKDLTSGAVALVVGGSAYLANAPGADARAPSISADGRYVSFTTRTPLDPIDDPGTGTSVYVRDMTIAPAGGGPCLSGLPCAYELASARDGSARGLTYSGGDGGATASPRVALSADGRRVAFVTTGDSDLTSGPDDATAGLPTPAGQVVLRDLDADRTTLVSTQRDAQTGAMTDLPVPGGAVMPTSAPGLPRIAGAALSADGTTVAWLGAHIPAQAPLLADEAHTIAVDDANEGRAYDEPLWRRIGDGPAAPTRRIVGGGDPLAPGCPPNGTLADATCQGPFPAIAQSAFVRDNATGWLGITAFANGVPQLSADGRTVALVGEPNGIANVFVVDMSEGLTRRDAVRQLTREVPLRDPSQANTPATIPSAGDVLDVGIASSGRRIAFATGRSEFPLAPPNLIGPTLAQLGLVELYRIDLDGEALERVTRSPAGGPSSASGQLLALSRDGASAPSFSADGSSLAFASSASNLVAGDANGASDAFIVLDPPMQSVPGAVTISPPPPQLSFAPQWRMAVSAASRPDGSVRLTIVVPGAGSLRATATAVVRIGSGERAARRRVVRSHLATRQVVAAGHRTRHDGLVTIALRLAPRYRSLARAQGGLDAMAHITFAAARRRPLHDALDVTFRVRRPHGARR